jgi:hypothetical protein
MVNINIFDNSGKVPQPRQQVRIEQVQAIPYADHQRVKAVVNVTPFIERPNLILLLKDTHGRTISELNIIETMHFEMEFTIHIRRHGQPGETFALEVELFYETRNPPHDKANCIFQIPAEELG